MNYTYPDIAKMIDHSLLNPALTANDLEQGIQLALAYDVASVCILPYFLKRCADRLRGSAVKASTTIGFPHGGHTTAVKLAEAMRALADGGEELDMVVNVSKVLSADWGYVRDDIGAVIETAHEARQKVKVIFENCYLNDAQKIRLCEICGDLGADWVKTSTGYGTGGATIEDLQLMRKHAPAEVQGRGGRRDLNGALRVRAIRVTRVGELNEKHAGRMPANACHPDQAAVPRRRQRRLRRESSRKSSPGFEMPGIRPAVPGIAITAQPPFPRYCRITGPLLVRLAPVNVKAPVFRIAASCPHPGGARRGSAYLTPARSRTPACISRLAGSRCELRVKSERHNHGSVAPARVCRVPMHRAPAASENRLENRGIEKRSVPTWPGELASG